MGHGVNLVPAGKLHLAVTNSEISTFRTCRQKWFFRHRERLRPKRRPRALAVGSMVHAGIAAVYGLIASKQRGVNASGIDYEALAVDTMQKRLAHYRKDIFDAMDEAKTTDEIDELLAESETAEREAEGSVLRFVQRFARDDEQRYKVVTVELPFTVLLRDKLGRKMSHALNAGVMDLVLYDQQLNELLLGEHKTSANDATKAEAKLDMDPQTSGYVWALREAMPELRRQLQNDPIGSMLRDDTKVGRVLYNVVRKKGPRQPTLNQDGSVSAAAVDTTRDVYEAALVDQERKGIPRTDKQRNRLESLSTRERYVTRLEVFHGNDVLERWHTEQKADASLVRLARDGRFPITRNPEACNPPWVPPCPYRTICIDDSPERRELAGYVTMAGVHEEVQEAIEQSAEEAEA